MELKVPLSSDDIRRLLPHTWPFLFLDRVVELTPGKRAVGIKNVTVSEPFFAGHFPGESIMPGALLVECLAQLTAIAYLSGYLANFNQQNPGATEPVDPASRVGYLVSIRNMKFSKPVRPGDQLTLEAVLGTSLGILTNVQVVARVEREVVAEGSIAVSQRPDAPAKG